MKKLIVFLLAAVLLLSCFAHAEESTRKTDFPDNTFVEMDPNYIAGVTQRGKTVLFRYDAQTAEGEAYTKSALVYVPYGYDPADTETHYNVMYLLHGHGGGYTTFFKGAGSFSNMQFTLDAMIEKGHIEPLFIVTPTYAVPGKDEYWGSANFWYELNNYLIPAFESEYHTYAQDVTPEGIRASRTHRALSGFSMGSLTTWVTFEHSLDQIAYYMPCCGGASFGPDAADAAQRLADSIAKAGYTKDDFFIYAGCGGEGDVGYAGLTAQIEAMKLLPDTFVYCENFRDGNLYYTQCSGGHSTKSVELIMYCALPTFFDK
ncbi:MAG: hypothetical protein E7318_06570 [Clostridiales bacterium]|nr:hypothetical protein [Clostridiales bacterium]